MAVVIPHYNDPDGLALCLDALTGQTLASDTFEIIVADNGSSLPHVELERLIDGRAKLVVERERGAAPARNRGVAETTAPLLAFIDADCVPDARWLEAGLAALESADLAGGAMRVTTRACVPRSGAECFETIFAFDNEANVLRKGFSVTANLFVRREVFERTGPFQTGVPEDLDWCRRATSLSYSLTYAAEAIVHHPARRDWPELKRKWQRLMAEGRALSHRQGKTGLWLARCWLLPASIIPDAFRVLLSGADLPDWASRFRAIRTLARLRIWRFFEAHRLMIKGASR